MTVMELIRELERFPEDDEVVLFDYDEDERPIESVCTHPHNASRVMIYP